MNWKIVLMCVMLFSIFTVGVAAAELTEAEIEAAQTEIETKICDVFNLVSLIGGMIGAVAVAVVGIMMMYTTDPAEKSQLKDRLKYIIMGVVLIILGPQLIKALGLASCGA